jgi:hypothetical protein
MIALFHFIEFLSCIKIFNKALIILKMFFVNILYFNFYIKVRQTNANVKINK